MLFSSQHLKTIVSKLKFLLLACVAAGSFLAANAEAAANSVVRFHISYGTTPFGDVDVELFDTDKPVTVSNFLRTAKTAVDGKAPALRTWVREMRTAMDALRMDPTFAERNVNEGFSGGEKKRHEILQLELLKPKVAILDETDSGLDVDALRVVSEGINRIRATGDVGVLLITHYTRILRYVKPDFVHVFVDGRIVAEGGSELAEQLEAEGYDPFIPAGIAGES